MAESLEIKRTFRWAGLASVALAVGTICVNSRNTDENTTIQTTKAEYSTAGQDDYFDAQFAMPLSGTDGLEDDGDAYTSDAAGVDYAAETALAAGPLNGPANGVPSAAVRLDKDALVAASRPWDGMVGTYTCMREAGITPCCPQWWETALQAGWPLAIMPEVDYIMAKESDCDPNNTGPYVNGYRAIGLMQLLGWGGKELYDPLLNLQKAREVYLLALKEYGNPWHPWCYHNDPVAGSC